MNTADRGLRTRRGIEGRTIVLLDGERIGFVDRVEGGWEPFSPTGPWPVEPTRKAALTVLVRAFDATVRA